MDEGEPISMPPPSDFENIALSEFGKTADTGELGICLVLFFLLTNLICQEPKKVAMWVRQRQLILQLDLEGLRVTPPLPNETSPTQAHRL